MTNFTAQLKLLKKACDMNNIYTEYSFSWIAYSPDGIMGQILLFIWLIIVAVVVISLSSDSEDTKPFWRRRSPQLTAAGLLVALVISGIALYQQHEAMQAKELFVAEERPDTTDAMLARLSAALLNDTGLFVDTASLEGTISNHSNNRTVTVKEGECISLLTFAWDLPDAYGTATVGVTVENLTKACNQN